MDERIRTGRAFIGLHGMPSKAFVLTSLVLLMGCVGVRAESLSGPALAKRIKTEYSKTPDVIYTPAGWPRSLPADVYSPKGSGPWPAVLVIYGGSWSPSDHRWQMSRIARKLAGRGYVVMNVTYRGAPDFYYPAQIDDLREALRWLRSHAAEYHVKPDKIGVYGFSAGGHLAALLGTLDGKPDVRVQAVVAASAPTDLTLYPGGEIVPRLIGATFADKPELFREASAITHVTPDDPPFFLYHGTDDHTVSPEHTQRFKAALDRAGVRNEVRWIEGRGHASMLLFNGAAEDAAIDFLDSALR